MFQPIGSRLNLPQLEEKVLELWRQNNTFKRSIESRQDGQKFTFYEGPPTANGSPGIHHVLSRVFKDAIPRFKAMKGFYTPRTGGWDTHGLPVELAVEKELGFSSKADIEEYGIAKFNKRCRESVFKYKKDWDELTERIAFWVDLDNAYITMDNNYIESGWWAIKQLWDKGLVYKGHRVTPHCPRCGTSLSSHEVALGYKDNTEDPSVYVKFKILPESLASAGIDEKTASIMTGKPSYMLAWTTTPWTLPANTALAIAAKDEYSVVANDNELLVLATARLEAAGLADAEVVAKVKGSQLAELMYEPLFDPNRFGVAASRMGDNPPAAEDDISYPVISASFVTMDDGTGVVHNAPAYGEVDYAAGIEKGLYFVHHVDLAGKITGSYSFAGKFVKSADPLISADLEERGLLFKAEKIKHTYPFCWRCGSPLLYFAKETWYIKTTAIKDKLISGNEEINWYPENIKHGRFGDWLANNVDWAISRERYWGTPLPIWQCQSCGQSEAVGGIDELKNKPSVKGLTEPLDLHRPYVDDITYNCPKCEGQMKRVVEVIDCWFDSGAMPFAQNHYPFENETMFDDGRFPADFISEAVDQTRGWFYSLHALSTLLFDRPSYRNVISLGHILDEKGEKMSKAKGNVVEPWAVINKHGADALRWYFYTATPPGNARRFSEKLVADVTKQFILTLWNVYSFFVTYANIDDYAPGQAAEGKPPELDRWIISELNLLVKEVDSALENYSPTDAGRRIEAFVDYLSNWYVRRSRRRFWKSESDADKLWAYNTLYQCLTTLAKLMAPLTPFLAEDIYQNLVCGVGKEAPDSVHLADFPVADESLIDEPLSVNVRLAMRLSSLGRAARAKAALKVRQPLTEAVIGLTSPREEAALEQVKDQIAEELNVKNVRPAVNEAELEKENYNAVSETGYTVAISTDITPELAAEGMARDIVHRLQMMRRSAGFEIADYINTYYTGDEYIRQVMTDFAEYIKRETLSRELVEADAPENISSEEYKPAGHEMKLAVAKIS